MNMSQIELNEVSKHNEAPDVMIRKVCCHYIVVQIARRQVPTVAVKLKYWWNVYLFTVSKAGWEWDNNRWEMRMKNWRIVECGGCASAHARTEKWNE